jgi:hypothetical protein
VSSSALHHDDLKVIWLCRECGSSFVFRSDVDDHEENEGHSKISKHLISNIDMDLDVGLEQV